MRLEVVVIAAAVAVGTMFLVEPLILQKALTKVVQPVGFLWLALLAITVCSWGRRRRWTAKLLTVVWLAYSLAGNPIAGDALLGTLENRFARIRPLQLDPFDTIVVLGGGTNVTTNLDPQFATSGDRVGLAARMYHAGVAQKILVTGKQIESLSVGIEGEPAAQALKLLTQLGVPEDRISMLAGRNTLEEMQNLKEILSGKGDDVDLSDNPADAHNASSSNRISPDFPTPRVGLITSAWHLPRAMRLAKKAGLEMMPVPADFVVVPRRRSILDLIPDHGAFRQSSIVVKEYLGMAVGR